jgi:hypothetical protein
VEIIEGKLKLDLTQVSLMIIDSPINEKEWRNGIADKFFDQFKVLPHFHFFIPFNLVMPYVNSFHFWSG